MFRSQYRYRKQELRRKPKQSGRVTQQVQKKNEKGKKEETDFKIG